MTARNWIAATLVASLIFCFDLCGPAFAQERFRGRDRRSPRPRSMDRSRSVVWNIRRGLGHVRVSICTRLTFASAQKACPYHGEAPAQQGLTTVVVPDVPAGTYAAEVYQDEDDRETIKRGPLGIPMEGVGFSNDVPIHLTPPRFSQAAAFDFDPSAAVVVADQAAVFPESVGAAAVAPWPRKGIIMPTMPSKLPSLGRLVALSIRRAWLTILIGLASATAAGIYGVGHFKMTTDTEQLISANLPWRQNGIAFAKAFPEQGDSIAVVVDGQNARAGEKAPPRPWPTSWPSGRTGS